MSKRETKEGAAVADQEQTPETVTPAEHVHGPDCDHDHEHEPRMEPITLELEDLTPEGKARAEKRLGRSIADIAYTVKESKTLPGSVTSLTIEVAREAFLAEQKQMLEDLARDVALPGFRKGKAPLKLLQIRMGEEAVRSTIGSLALNALRQENGAKNYEFVAKPKIADYSVEGHGQEPVSFEVEVETMPKVEVTECSGMTVEVEDRPVTEETITQRIDQMRHQNAVLEAAAEGATLNEADTAVIKADVTNEQGEPLAHLSKESQTVYNVKRDLPEQVGEQLIGKKAGDVIEAQVPAKVTNRRGEEIEHHDHWKVELLEIKATKLPELDDEFAKDLGSDSLDALKAKIREDLVKAEEDRQQSEAFGKLLRLMVEKNPIDAPRSLLAHRQYELIMQDQYQLQRLGLRLDQVVTDTEKYLRDQRASADELVKIQMLTAELSRREGLDVSDEDVEKEIAHVAEQTGRKPLAVRARLEAQKQLPQFRENIARKKIQEFLFARNTIQKVAPKPEEDKAPAE